MKIKIGPSMAVRRARRIKKKEQKVRSWHEKFAWMPKRIDDNSEEVVWLEKYWTKKLVGNGVASHIEEWPCLSKEEYFKMIIASENGVLEIEKKQHIRRESSKFFNKQATPTMAELKKRLMGINKNQ